jgi:class 3 adenylate cyclase
MSKPEDELKIETKVVLVIDICSSSEIMEDLLRTQDIVKWRNLLIILKEYLVEESKKLDFEVYKFIGDGWILLFNSEYNGKRLLNFLVDLSKKFKMEFQDSIFRYLEKPPDIDGLTFGMDSGRLLLIEMMDRQEYVGRAINVAARLQGTVGDTDISEGYRVMISNMLFQRMKDELNDFHPELVKRRLKNIITGREFPCYRLAISEIPFKIIKAIYGTAEKTVNVTAELISQIKGNRIDTFVTNYLLGGDPTPGITKSLDVEYICNGEVLKKTARENARIQLP